MGISPNVLPQQPLLSILKHHQVELLGARGSLRTSASSICPRAICYERRAPWGVAAGEDDGDIMGHYWGYPTCMG